MKPTPRRGSTCFASWTEKSSNIGTPPLKAPDQRELPRRTKAEADVSTRTRMTTWRGLVATTAIALVAAQVGLSLQAQTLLAPSFTTAQATAGRSTYTQDCASCHGANLDDGAFGPALRGPEFRAS